VKQCGKSRLLEIIESLAHEPISTTNISVAALFRMIDAGGERPPTLLLDEADRLFGSAKKDEDNRDLIGLLNNGFRQGAPTWRCVGPMQTPTPFSNYAMAVVAGIGRKPDTIENRAVNITMRRRLPGEMVAKFRLRTDRPALEELRDQLAAWVEQRLDVLAKPIEDIPAALEDRAADAWEPLLAVAYAAGGDWPSLARAAARALSAEAAEADGQAEEIRLLVDVAEVFDRMVNVNFLATRLLLAELRKVEDAPWGEQDFTARRLAARLANFEIRPRPNTARTERGYHRIDFKDPFSRYLPSKPSDPSETGDDQPERRDGSKPPDGSTRPAFSTRPDETARQTANGRVRTGWTHTPQPREVS
jgi:hypothetical protein